MYSGDFISGGMIGAIGLKECYNQYSAKPNEELENHLLYFDRRVLHWRKKAELQPYEEIEDDLGKVQNDLETLKAEIARCAKINAAVNPQLLTEEEAAEREILDQALSNTRCLVGWWLCSCREAISAFSAAKEIYEKYKESLFNIQSLAKADHTEVPLSKRMQTLKSSVHQLRSDLEQSTQKLDFAIQYLSDALTSLESHTRHYLLPLHLVLIVIPDAGGRLCRVKCKCSTDKTQLKEIAAYNREIKRNLDDIYLDTQKLEASQKLNLFDKGVGVGTGVFCASMGNPAAPLIGATATYAWHYGTVIQRVQDFVLRRMVDAIFPENLIGLK